MTMTGPCYNDNVNDERQFHLQKNNHIRSINDKLHWQQQWQPFTMSASIAE